MCVLLEKPYLRKITGMCVLPEKSDLFDEEVERYMLQKARLLLEI